VFYPIRRYSGKFSPTNRRLRYFQRALELFETVAVLIDSQNYESSRVVYAIAMPVTPRKRLRWCLSIFAFVIVGLALVVRGSWRSQSWFLRILQPEEGDARRATPRERLDFTFENRANRIRDATNHSNDTASTPKHPTPDVFGWNRCRQVSCSKSDNCAALDSSPPSERCCWLMLKELLGALRTFLSQHDIPFYVMFGTLLGARRDAGIMHWTSDVDIAVESSSIAILESINEWNDRYYFWMENKHIGRMCITDYENPEAKTWGAWDKIPTYVDVYIPKHVSKNMSGFTESKTVFPVVSKCVFNTIDVYGRDIVGQVDASIEHNASTKLKIGELLVDAPRNVDVLLSQIYGSDWRQPDAKKSNHGSNWCEGDDAAEFKKLVSLTARVP